MCGRYVLPDEEEIRKHWAIARCSCRGPFKPRFNVPPTAQVPMVVATPAGLHLQRARWGLIPGWWRHDAPPPRTFNARSEDLLRKPMWRERLRSGRCLLPARGWYEWHKNGVARQPFFMSSPGDPVMAFAGLWAVWNGPAADPVVSCAVLTRKATPRLAAIHPRMPVVLKPEHGAAWLDAGTPDRELWRLIEDVRDDLSGHAVGLGVNHVRNDEPGLMAARVVPTQMDWPGFR